MELLLILTYAAICVAIFKIFRIPANKWTLSTAVLGGIFLIGSIVLIMNYNHPFTDNARIYFATTPIIPDVKGRVIEVPVKSNEQLKQGDVLFRIDPSLYQFEVAQRRAALAEAEQNVAQLKAALDSAEAATRAAAAEYDRAKKSFDRVNEGNEGARKRGNPLPFSIADVENRRGVYLKAEGTMQAEAARAEQARVVYQSQIGGVHTSVARLRADLRDAEYNLELTTVRAPGPGFVTQVALRPGMFVVPAPFRPVMVFVHQDDRVLSAGFQQNALQRVRPGDEAEVAFDAIPGRIFKGKVQRVLDAIATGQFQAAGTLQDMGERPLGGRAVALIHIDEDTSAYNIPGGAAAQVAVYTEHAHHFAIIRRVLLRMRSWQNYLFFEGHSSPGNKGGGGH
jgi:multidrug resistance efflux pump